MDNAVLVNVGEGIGDFAQHAHRLANRELPVALQSGPQRFAFDERHHILPFHDSGEVEGALYYVMPLVDGETLRARLDRDGRLPVDDALRVTREVADVSLEQAVGEANIDGRSDLYSLGCVLYEMLTGQPPFTGATAAAITQQHLIAEPVPVTAARPDMPAAVSGALSSVLAKDPSHRPDPAARFVEALSSPESAAVDHARRRGGTGQRARRIALAATGLVALLAAAWFASQRKSATASAIDRIAVLPMDNETGDSAQAFFADGMTREVIGILTDAGVHVLGYRAVAPYRNSTKSTRVIAQELGVDAIVSGSVQRAGEVISLSAELINAATDENLWSRTFKRPAADVITLQRAVAADIARGIRARLTPDQQQRLAATRQVNPRAYAQYLLGEEAATLRTADNFRRSVTYIRRSLDIDSTYAPAWATLASPIPIPIVLLTLHPDRALDNRDTPFAPQVWPLAQHLVFEVVGEAERW